MKPTAASSIELGHEQSIARGLLGLPDRCAAVLGQTLFFKFTYAPETQWIFGEKLHVGRTGATLTGLRWLHES